MIYFVGAGPGNVDLITVKGREVIQQADIIIYAGSLVSKQHLAFSKKECNYYNSAKMTLEEVIDIIKNNKNKIIVRLHTGDPSIYGAIREQMDELDKLNLKYKIIPGVSSFTAAAAAIKKEFTLPNISQTVILTRIKGRTAVPELENLTELAKHHSSMAIFLSAGHFHNVVESLIKGYEDINTPIAVVYKASWEDEKIIIGTLKDIEEKFNQSQINKTAQILVGKFIQGDYLRSKLYSGNFSHEYRKEEETNNYE